jgi:hypothetical protein
MPGSGWAVKFSGFAAMSKETFTASIELTGEEAALVRETAAYFKMELPEFLAAALRGGISHAQDKAEIAQTFCDPARLAEDEADAKAFAKAASSATIIDDDIPF